MLNFDIVVIGGGPAGLAAAIEAKKNGVEKILLIERDMELGGILNQCIHSGFGLHFLKKELTGPEYAHIFINELKKLDIQYKVGTTVLEISKDKYVTCINPEDGLMKVKAKAIILAMGCRERTRGAIGIPGKRPSGIFTAGTAQRYINIEGCMIGKKVLILGSGDIGLIMARRLVLEGAEVLAVVEKMAKPGGLQRNIAQCLEDFQIPLLLSHTVTEILGKHRIEGIVISRVDDNGCAIFGTEKKLSCDTLLLSVGLIPEVELAKNMSIEMDKNTYGIKIDNLMESSLSGVFACGNVVKVHCLVDDVTEQAILTGKNAAIYIKRCVN